MPRKGAKAGSQGEAPSTGTQRAQALLWPHQEGLGAGSASGLSHSPGPPVARISARLAHKFPEPHVGLTGTMETWLDSVGGAGPWAGSQPTRHPEPLVHRVLCPEESKVSRISYFPYIGIKASDRTTLCLRWKVEHPLTPLRPNALMQKTAELIDPAAQHAPRNVSPLSRP